MNEGRRRSRPVCRRLPGLDARQTAHVRASLASRAGWNRQRPDNPSTAQGLAPGAGSCPMPEEVDIHIAYGFHYALGCLRQDRPSLYWAGIAGLLYLTIRTVTALLVALLG